MSKFKDLTGQKFNRLTVIECVQKATRSNGGTYWLCKCDCGKQIKVFQGNLTSNHTKSCGCLDIEKATKRVNNFIKSDKGKELINKIATEINPYHGERIREQQIKGIKYKNNTSGVTGVSQRRDGKYNAYLQYRGTMYMTTCKTFDKAVLWRKQKEEELGIYTEDGIKAKEKSNE